MDIADPRGAAGAAATRRGAGRLARALVMGLGALSLANCGSDDSTTDPDLSSSTLHVYPAYGLTSGVSCSRTRIKVVYFVPRGEEAYASATWRADAASRYAEIKAFFEREFARQIRVRFDVAPRYVVGQQSRYTYASELFPEIRSSVFSPGGSYYDAAFAAEQADEYTVRMIYYLNRGDGALVALPGGGAWVTAKMAIVPAFWLEPTELSGGVNSAHEFGHLLGMPHPWEMQPPQGDALGNLMGYNTGGLALTQCHIPVDVKEAMGMHKCVRTANSCSGRS
jgi:hypothetical protein